MTKVFALLSIAAVFAFASCAEKKVEDTAVVDTTVIVPVEVVPVADSVAVAPDSATTTTTTTTTTTEVAK
jgi:hypothetical protein